MNRTILVPIDISDSELTQRVISHVEAEAKIDDAEVHFLDGNTFTDPTNASLGFSVFRRLPAMDDLKAEAKIANWKRIIKKFKTAKPTECMSMLRKARPKTAFWNWRRRSPLI